MALREVYARAATSNEVLLARTDLNAWLSWARRCRLVPLKKLAKTIAERAERAKTMDGLLQQAKRAASGFRTSTNFIAIAYLRMSKLKQLPAHPFALAAPK